MYRRLLNMKIFIFVICFLLIFSYPMKANTDNNDTIKVKAGYLKNQDNTVLFKNGVDIMKGNIKLFSKEGTMKRENKNLILKNNVKMLFKKGEIRSNRVKALMNKNKYIFKDNVIFDYTSNKNNNDFLLKAPILEVLTKDNSFIAKNGVEIDYKEKKIKSIKAEYKSSKDQLILEDNVHIKEKNGEWIKSKKAVIYLNEKDSFTAEGEVNLNLTIN